MIQTHFRPSLTRVLTEPALRTRAGDRTQDQEQMNQRWDKEQTDPSSHMHAERAYVPLLQLEEAAPLFHAPTAMASPGLLEATP